MSTDEQAHAREDEHFQYHATDLDLSGEGAGDLSIVCKDVRKRLGGARALVMEPDVVIFDEPDSGLDPVRTALLCDLIQEMHGIHGGTYIVVTHNIASARQIGEYIAVLWRGRIVEAGDAERMFSSDNPFVHQFLSGSADGPLPMD